MTINLPPPSKDDAAGLNAAEGGAHGGGWLATAFSAMALVFSSVSFYLTALQQADLDVFVPPVLQYARDGGGDIDVFAVPITIANGGANTGTVLSMELTVENAAATAEAKSKVFYSAYLGEHPRDAATTGKAFAPISVPGRATFTETIRFYPQGNPLPKVVSEAGEYRFKLSFTIAEPVEPSLLDRIVKIRAPSPITFTRRIPYISDQGLGFRRGTIPMHAADWQPTAGTSR